MNNMDYAGTLRKAAALIDLKYAAQAVLDIERPGETVQEVLINSDSAKSLKKLLTPSAPLVPMAPVVPKAKKTVYRLMAYDTVINDVWVSNNMGRTNVEEGYNSVLELLEAKKKTAILSNTLQYFVQAFEVEA